MAGRTDQASTSTTCAPYAWMIERHADITNDSSQPLWWDGRDFSPNPNAGVRFTREIDAARVVETHGLRHAKATEHGWFSPDDEARNERAAWLDEKKANEQ